MINWDFRYVESHRYRNRQGFNPTQLRGAVAPDDRYWKRRHRRRLRSWLWLLVIVTLCLWGLWRLRG